MTALFVQPHFDDVALSAGGTVALAGAAGDDPLIVTVFSRAPDPGAPLSDLARELHRRWGGEPDAVWAERRREDGAAAAILGARTHSLGHHDAIYRGDHYATIPALRGPPVGADEPLRETIEGQLIALARENQATRVYLPLGVGGHVDHRLVHATGRRLANAGLDVVYYEDFPYVTVRGSLDERVRELARDLTSHVVDTASTVDVRISAIRAYASQLATLFRADGPFPGPFERLVPSQERFWRDVTA